MERLLKPYLRLAIRRAGSVVIAMGLISAGVAYWLMAHSPLGLDTNFTTLLPDELPCVIESRRISTLIGSTDYLIVAIDSPVVADNVAFADDIARELASLEELTYVATKQDKTFFRDHRLLYLDLEDLKKLVNRAKDRLDYEKKIRNPFYIALEEEAPPDIDIEDVMTPLKERLKRRGAAVGLAQIDGQQNDHGLGTEDRLIAKGGTLMSVIARPKKPALDMNFGRALVEKTEALIARLNPRRNPDMRVEVAGPYRNRYREYNNVIGDIFSSLAVSISLILLIITVYFRRVRIVLLIFVPLAVGILWTVGLTALTLERLNMTTALIFAVLLGLGIDFGVHMSVRYLDERARGKSLEDALALAVIHTGKAILTAGLTTAGGLAVLILARFKGFSEFGLIATMGITTCLLVYTLLLPALAVLMERISTPKPWRKRVVQRPDRSTSVSLSTGWLGAAIGGVALLAGLGFTSAGKIDFEYDFRNLRGERVSASIDYGKTLGQGSSPVVAVLPTPEDAQALTRHLESIIDNDVDNKDLVKRAFSIFSFIPEDQEPKLAQLKQLRSHVDSALGLSRLEKDTRETLAQIRHWTTANPFGIDSLPQWVKDKFQEKDGTLGRMVYLYPRANEWIISEIERFYEAYGSIDVPGKGEVRPSASGFIMVEVVRAVQRDGWLMTVAATAVVLVLLLLDLRSLKSALMVFAPLIVGAAWTMGIMAIFDIRIGLYNMLVLPTMLGIGVDASVHLYHAYREHGPGSLGYVLKTTGAAIAVAAATTAVGFVGMLVVSHAGLRSIGILALIGIGATLTAALVTLPLELALGETMRFRSRAKAIKR
ncbi:MAG: MMPL family transporter [Myxococcota bacterium]|nr:MMPL family transporter [Myxococcota bacterium]